MNKYTWIFKARNLYKFEFKCLFKFIDKTLLKRSIDKLSKLKKNSIYLRHIRDK